MELLFVLNKVHFNAMYKGKSPAQSCFVEKKRSFRPNMSLDVNCLAWCTDPPDVQYTHDLSITLS